MYDLLITGDTVAEAAALHAALLEECQVVACDWKSLASGGRVYHVQTVSNGQEVLGWGPTAVEALRDAKAKAESKKAKTTPERP